MQPRIERSPRGLPKKRSPAPTEASPAEVVTQAPAPAVDAPAISDGPRERREDGTEIDWGRPETLRQTSGVWVALWLFVPLFLCLIYGYFTR